MRYLITVALFCLAAQPSAAQRTSYEELQTFSGVLAHIRTNYVDSVGQSDLVRSAIAGALHALDPHTVYLRAGTIDRLQAARAGLAASIGARLDHDGQRVVVLSVGSSSPGERAGLRAGDRLLAVNDTPVAGMSAEEAEALLAGDAGTRVQLRLERGPVTAPEPIQLTLKRTLYRWPSVPAALALDSATVYVRLEGFADGSAKELERAIRDLTSRARRQVILDLRGNPGGLVDEAADIAGLFLPKHSVSMRMVGRRGRADSLLTNGGSLRDLPLVVLVDGGSASASEALAAALQDHDRARVAGRRSFGKALMQTSLPLPGGDVLMLTTARIYSPARRALQREFRGLTRAQYFAMAGDSTAPARDAVHSFGGRPLDPGPGVAPDLALPPLPNAPPWWSRARDAGLEVAVADAAASAVQDDRDVWEVSAERWATLLADPLLLLVREQLGIEADLDATQRQYVARVLAARVAQVKWGEAALARFLATTDPDIAAARALFH